MLRRKIKGSYSTQPPPVVAENSPAAAACFRGLVAF
jgi:hypothetical protein